jgi:protein required for attachment to host cells
MQNREHLHTWVVVADSALAKLFRVVKFPKLQEITILQHPESRLHNQDLISSRPGRGNHKGGTTYSYASEVSPKQHEAAKFAIYLADYLSKAEKNGEFNRLYLLANPTFLGLVRQHLTSDVQKAIIAELPIELTAAETSVIEGHIKAI